MNVIATIDQLQGCSNSESCWESENESRSSSVVRRIRGFGDNALYKSTFYLLTYLQTVSAVRTREQFSFQACLSRAMHAHSVRDLPNLAHQGGHVVMGSTVSSYTHGTQAVQLAHAAIFASFIVAYLYTNTSDPKVTKQS